MYYEGAADASHAGGAVYSVLYADASRATMAREVLAALVAAPPPPALAEAVRFAGGARAESQSQSQSQSQPQPHSQSQSQQPQGSQAFQPPPPPPQRRRTSEELLEEGRSLAARLVDVADAVAPGADEAAVVAALKGAYRVRELTALARFVAGCRCVVSSRLPLPPHSQRHHSANGTPGGSTTKDELAPVVLRVWRDGSLAAALLVSLAPPPPRGFSSAEHEAAGAPDETAADNRALGLDASWVIVDDVPVAMVPLDATANRALWQECPSP